MRLAEKAGIHYTTIYLWISGKTRPTYSKAIKTGIHPKAWDYPQDFFNPLIPYKYTGPWPPPLDHLQGEAREWAEQIVRAFPQGPPSKEEFKRWKRRRKKHG